MSSQSLSAPTLGLRRLICVFVLMAAALLVSGCASRPQFSPRPAFSVDEDIRQLHEEFDTAASIKGYYASGGDTLAKRDTFIAGRLALYDLEYLRFISRYRLSRAEQNTAFDAVALGIGVATTTVSGAGAKTVLGAVTTALTGLRTSYEKNFYDDKTAAALVAQMTAERKKALVPIIRGLRMSVEDYPITVAIVDLAAYQQAGTIDGALAGVQQDAVVKDAAASDQLARFRVSSYRPDDSSQRILRWLWPGFVQADKDGTFRDAAGQPISRNDANYNMLQQRLSSAGLSGLPIPALLGNAMLAEVRSNLIRDLSIP